MSGPKFQFLKVRLAAFCAKWKIVELAVFGSALRADFRPDIDILVSFAPNAR